LPKLS